MPTPQTPYQRRNERAKQEGYKSYYDKRIKEGLKRGYTKSQSAGKPKPQEKKVKNLTKRERISLKESAKAVLTYDAKVPFDDNGKERFAIYKSYSWKNPQVLSEKTIKTAEDYYAIADTIIPIDPDGIAEGIRLAHKQGYTTYRIIYHGLYVKGDYIKWASVSSVQATINVKSSYSQTSEEHFVYFSRIDVMFKRYEDVK